LQLDICEIFYSLQGESTFTGLPCIFIRLARCNLNCSWCDTRYANTDFQSMTLEKILKKTAAYHCRLVEITGGEPLLQENTPCLISRLLDQNHQVLLETNGSLSLKHIDPRCIKIMDIKCPSSNEKDNFLLENIRFLTHHDEIKFVIGSQKDYDYAKFMILNHLTDITQDKIHLSPVFGQISPGRIAQWMLADKLCARLSLQQHKIIWDPDRRGV